MESSTTEFLTGQALPEIDGEFEILEIDGEFDYRIFY
jgi:hypothetical protein